MPGVAERLVGKEALEHGNCLDQACLPDRHRIEGDAALFVLGHVPAGADGHVQPALAEHVERREVLCQDRGMAQVVVEHERRDPQRRRCGGHDGHRGDGRELVDEMVRNDQGVVAGGLGSSGCFAELPR